MVELTEAIRLLLANRGITALDLYEIATLLRVQFPGFSTVDLARQVAEIGVEEGARYLIWEPPNKPE